MIGRLTVSIPYINDTFGYLFVYRADSLSIQFNSIQFNSVLYSDFKYILAHLQNIL